MKTFFLIVFAGCSFLLPPSLSQLRALYKDASSNVTIAHKLHEDLKEVDKHDNAVLYAYKGGVMTLMARHTKKKKDKKEFFKNGAEAIEFAVSKAPHKIEIRFIRLTVQESAPRFLKYHTNIEEDKQFIINNFEHTVSKELKVLIREYVMQSDAFSASEKMKF